MAVIVTSTTVVHGGFYYSAKPSNVQKVSGKVVCNDDRSEE